MCLCAVILLLLIIKITQRYVLFLLQGFPLQIGSKILQIDSRNHPNKSCLNVSPKTILLVPSDLKRVQAGEKLDHFCENEKCLDL